MDNETTTAVDSAATSSAPATTPAHNEQTNSASGIRVPPLSECLCTTWYLCSYFGLRVKLCVISALLKAHSTPAIG